MRDFLKIVYITVVGLIVAVFIYPLLHEAGHAIATVCLGGQITEFSVFPVAYTGCEVIEIDTYGKIIVGLSGMILPMIISAASPRNFYSWYPLFVLRGISFLAFVISSVSIILSFHGTFVANEDVAQLLRLCGDKTTLICTLVVMMLLVSAALLLTGRPIKRFCKYLMN